MTVCETLAPPRPQLVTMVNNTAVLRLNCSVKVVAPLGAVILRVSRLTSPDSCGHQGASPEMEKIVLAS